MGLDFRLGLAQARDSIALFPGAAFLEEFNPFKSFQDVAFGPKGAGAT
jgi:hypothetical protein